MKINSIIDLVKDLDTSRQTKNLNKLLIRILLHLQVEFSPYQSTTLLDFMSIAYNYCLKTQRNSLDNMTCYRDDLKHKVMLFLTKYYPSGFKKNKKGLSDTCNKELLKYRKPRFKRDFLGEYEPIERIWFILALRACHSFLLSGHLMGDIDQFAYKLEKIALMMKGEI